MRLFVPGLAEAILGRTGCPRLPKQMRTAVVFFCLTEVSLKKAVPRLDRSQIRTVCHARRESPKCLLPIAAVHSQPRLMEDRPGARFPPKRVGSEPSQSLCRRSSREKD